MTLADDLRRARERREAIAAMRPIPVEGVLWMHDDPGTLLTLEEDREAMGEDADDRA